MLFCQLDSDSAGVGDENCCCCRLTRLLRIIWVNACSEVWRQHYQHWSQGSGSHREHNCYRDDCPWPSSKVRCQFSRQAASRLSMKTTRTQEKSRLLALRSTIRRAAVLAQFAECGHWIRAPGATASGVLLDEGPGKQTGTDLRGASFKPKDPCSWKITRCTSDKTDRQTHDGSRSTGAPSIGTHHLHTK